MSIPAEGTIDPARLARAVRTHLGRHHESLRRPSVTLQATVVFAAFALVPLVPGAHRLVRVRFEDTALWMTLQTVATWTVMLIYRRHPFPSRVYVLADKAETTLYTFAPVMLVVASGSTASVWWVVYFALTVVNVTGGVVGWYEPAVAGVAAGVGGLLLWQRTGTWAELVECLGVGAIDLIIFFLLHGATQRGIRLEAERDLLRARVAELEREQERVRISQELHDGLGGELTAIALMGEAAMQQHPEARSPLEGMVGRARRSIEEVRAAIWSARAAQQGWPELVAHLRTVGADLCRAGGVAFGLEVRGEATLGIAQRHQLLRILQELLHNALLHARPERIDATLSVEAGRLTLVVRDDGPGIPADAFGRGRGLAGLGRRADSLGGRLEITPDGAARLTFPLTGRAEPPRQSA